MKVWGKEISRNELLELLSPAALAMDGIDTSNLTDRQLLNLVRSGRY